MLSFGILVPQDKPWNAIAGHARAAEAAGFDSVWVADVARNYEDPERDWLDGWTVLAALATQTSSVQLGPLVANPVLRPPSTLALQSLSLNHLSGGRFRLGIGAGIMPSDHQATGTPYWPMRERVARFAEYVRIVDGLLGSARQAFEYEGRFYTTAGLSLRTPAGPRPRPPITIGGQSPTVRRTAVELAECWNTTGPPGASVDDVLAITREQNAELDRLCEDVGRDPAGLRRSLLCFERLDPWAAGVRIDEIVARFREIGMTEFIFLWPPDDDLEPLERVMRAA